jgi:hypothetical protein
VAELALRALRAPSIVVLFKPCGPTAIVWFIVSIVVDAIKCISTRGTRTHVCEEQNEILPSFAYRNSPRAVVFEAFIVWVATATQHASPDVIFRQTMRLAVRAGSFRNLFALKAPTRLGSSITKITTFGERFFATIAKTFPQLLVGVIGDGDKASETLVRNINELWHPAILAYP